MVDPRGVRCRAVSASPAALTLAAATSPGPARVHSVFRSAVNIETSAGLLTLATATTGGLPNGLVLDVEDLRTLGLQPGWLVSEVAGELRIPRAGVAIDLRGAAVGSPRFAPRREHRTRLLARWRSRSATAWQAARMVAPRGGLRPLFWSANPGRVDHPVPAFAWLPRARTSLDALTEAITRPDRAAAVDAARGLIGLGEGATPSGDDALVGVEAALHALDDPLAGALADALDDVEERTTFVAAAFLRHAARGEFADRLHDLLGALLDAPDDRIAPAIGRAAAWGASSGADGLLGVLRTLDAVAERPVARRKTA